MKQSKDGLQEKKALEIERSDCGYRSGVEGRAGGLFQVGVGASLEHMGDMALNLVNIPLQFTSQGRFSVRGGADKIIA
ncbi:UNVERIFIED_CONTAM: hypothetical protein Sradi_3982500 [Sesamum radiatum]|uniref:Uncharacterized protein n=1 Tax=Sesamum radiatum TaxID=300843 RepID=A0AAW2PLR9_SESRA